MPTNNLRSSDRITLRNQQGVPYFHRRILKERGEDKTIFVVKTQEQHRTGHTTHQKEIALKRYTSRKERFFSRERCMLGIMQHLNNQYIISLLASYQNDDGLFVALPLGECNLFEFWMSTDPTSDLPGYAAWFGDQAAGLTNALSMMHQISRSDDAGQYSSAPICISRPVGILHGDIKPGNMVIFPNGGMRKPTIKFIDFEMSFWSDDIIPKLPIRTYEAPEIRVDGTMSMASDIWSLGCVFQEFAIWICGGAEAVAAAGERRLTPTPGSSTPWLEDDRFFLLEYNDGNLVGAKVKDVVVDSMHRVLQKGQDTPLTQQIVEAMRTGMLITRPEGRMHARELSNTFQTILTSGCC